MNATTRSALLALAVALSSSPAPAEEEPAARRAFLGLPAGAFGPVLFVHTLETVQDATLGGKRLRTESAAVTEFSLEAEGRPESGPRTGRLRFGRCRFRLDSPLLGKVDYASDGPLPGSGTARLLALSVAGIGGREFGVDLSPGGEIERVRGVEDAVVARARELGLDETGTDLLRSITTREKVALVVNGALSATPLPARPVEEGDAWEDEDVVPGTARDVELRLRQTLGLVRVGEGEALLEGEGKVRALSSDPNFTETAGEDVAKDGRLSSRARVSLEDGLPLEGSVEASFGMRFLDGRGKVAQTMKASLVRVDAWPSRRPPEPEPDPK